MALAMRPEMEMALAMAKVYAGAWASLVAFRGWLSHHCWQVNILLLLTRT
jgi:hypothetical protein